MAEVTAVPPFEYPFKTLVITGMQYRTLDICHT